MERQFTSKLISFPFNKRFVLFYPIFVKLERVCFKKVQIPSLYLYFFPYIFKIPPIVLFMAPECVDKIEAPPAKITTSPSCT